MQPLRRAFVLVHHQSPLAVSAARAHRPGRPYSAHARHAPQRQQRQQQRQAVAAPALSSSGEVAVAGVPVWSGPPLALLHDLLGRKAYSSVATYVDVHFDADRQSLVDFCGGPCDVRDVVLLLMRTYVALGQMDKVRRLFLVALRDLGTSSSLPPLLNANVFNGYLEALTRRKNFDKDEVLYVLRAMQEAGVATDALTYHYLVELHVRAGYDPAPLWAEMVHERGLTPLPATVQAALLRVVPTATDGAFVVEVVREALKHGAAVLDKRILAELIEQWLRGSSTSSSSSSTTAVAGTGRFPPEYVMWLMLELEVRCVLDKASFVQYIQKQHVAELLLLCAKSADAATAAEVLALMDRHVMTKTADVLSLVVWCWAQAGELERALDMVELMARKGYLELTDPTRRYHIECLRYTTDRNFLAALADAISSPVLYQRVLAHIEQRRRSGLAVSVHALDVLVLAAGKLGEERAALRLALSYSTVWAVQPRTATLNCLLVGCSAQQSSVLLGTLYEAMVAAGVTPNPLTFRVLIRQSVLNDCVDDAVRYLEEVVRQPGLRVEVEMLLPILERAARVGDVETVNRVSKFSLDCDIGIDGTVLQSIMKYLAEAGQSVDVIRGHQPLHEALRSRSKVGRQRARSELLL